MNDAPVVVGVDETADARSAVLWAAYEASLAQTSLLIVHSPALPVAGTAPGLLTTALRAYDDVGRSVLEASAALARAYQPEVAVNVLLSHADPAQALIDVSAEAQLVVLGSRPDSRGDMSLLASKRLLVSAHAHCPVLLLGPVSTFSPPRDVSRVVTGVADTKAGRAAMAYAAAEAVRRDLALHLVRLDKTSPDYLAHPRLGIAGDPAGPLGAEVLRIRSQHSGLTVTADCAVGDPAELLPYYSDSSTLLVVGCRHSDDHWSTRLGPVATSVVHRNRGAVVVVGYSSFLSA